MEENQILILARSIDIKALCEAWGLSAEAVRSRLTGKRDLTVREVGAMAKILGVRTHDSPDSQSGESSCGRFLEF